MLYDIDTVRHNIQKAYSSLGKWEAVAALFGVTPALVWRIAHNGYEPKRPAIREALGLLPRCELIEGVLNVPDGVTAVRLPNNAKALKCANPDCSVWFVRCHPRQRYCRKECRQG